MMLSLGARCLGYWTASKGVGEDGRCKERKDRTRKRKGREARWKGDNKARGGRESRHMGEWDRGRWDERQGIGKTTSGNRG